MRKVSASQMLILHGAGLQIPLNGSGVVGKRKKSASEMLIFHGVGLQIPLNGGRVIEERRRKEGVRMKERVKKG